LPSIGEDVLSFARLLEVKFGENVISEIYYFCGYIPLYQRPERVLLRVTAFIDASEQFSFTLLYVILADKYTKLQI
jgi:hypothetical protein